MVKSGFRAILFLMLAAFALGGGSGFALAQQQQPQEQLPKGGYYLKKDPKTGAVQLDDQPEEPQPDEPQTMGEYANRFFTACMTQDNRLLKGENKEMFCGCTSAKMTEVMTVADMRAMDRPETKEGQYQRNRMLMFVYTPCIAYPTKALVESQCLSQAATMYNPVETCRCIGDGMAEYMQIEAPKVIEDALRYKGPNIDPLQVLLESPEFDIQNKSLTARCTGLHEVQRRKFKERNEK